VYACSCALKFMKFFLWIHCYTVCVKIFQATPLVLIIKSLQGIKITGGKLHKNKIHVQLVACTIGGQHKMLSPRDQWKLNQIEP
jgi:hypothetical protein